MTPQEIFDKSCRQIISQGGPSFRPHNGAFANGYCAYRGRNGRMCAAGAVLPDDVVEGREGLNVLDLEGNGLLPSWASANLTLLKDLQAAHDCELRRFSSRDWARKLRYLAGKHGLDTTVVQEADAFAGLA